MNEIKLCIAFDGCGRILKAISMKGL